jgi:hypothetical protein
MKQSAKNALAWRFILDLEPKASDQEVIVVKEPRNVIVGVTPAEPEALLADLEPQSHGSFEVIWIPPGVDNPPNVERDAEKWIVSGLSSLRRRPVHAGVRTVRVVWQDARALVYARPETVHDILEAILRFTIIEREMMALESAIASILETAGTVVPLTHSITRKQLARQRQVNDMTERVARVRMMLLRIATALKQIDPNITEGSGRLYQELVLAVDLSDRVEMLDNSTQYALDLYELANTRLIDAKTAKGDRRSSRIGHLLETMIVLLLVVQIFEGLPRQLLGSLGILVGAEAAKVSASSETPRDGIATLPSGVPDRLMKSDFGGPRETISIQERNLKHTIDSRCGLLGFDYCFAPSELGVFHQPVDAVEPKKAPAPAEPSRDRRVTFPGIMPDIAAGTFAVPLPPKRSAEAASKLKEEAERPANVHSDRKPLAKSHPVENRRRAKANRSRKAHQAKKRATPRRDQIF